MRLETYLERTAERFHGKTALVCDGARVSYGALDDATKQFAAALVASGVGRGDRVAICLENCVEAVIAIYGALRAGAVFVVVNWAVKAEKLRFVLEDCGATLLVTRAAKADELAGDTGTLRTIVVIGAAPPTSDPRAHGWDAWMSSAAAAPRLRITGIDLDLAALIYTSGSTGAPKGVMMAHWNMAAAASSVIDYLGNDEHDVILDVLPLSFSYGLHQVLTAVQVGATVVLEKSFAYPQVVLQRIAAERATGFAMVPTIAAVLLQQDLAAHDLASLRYVTNAGAALPPEHARALQARLPRARIFLMYGQTECKRVSYLPPEDLLRRPDSVGIPMPNVEAWVVDETGRRLGPGQVGELVVRGANVMRGYWNRGEETERALRPGPPPGDRVLHTGDLFRIDEDGYLYFVGRRDDIIKSRGEKVSPTEIENMLYRLDGVALAAVVGVPDAVLGSAVKAIIALKEGARLTEIEVKRHCARHLEDFMVPRIVEFRASLPRNEAGKIDRRRLADGEGCA